MAGRFVMSMKLMLKKIIKAFIPYGILVLRREIRKKNSWQLDKEKKQSNLLPELAIEYSVAPELGENIVKIVHKNYKYPIFLRNKTTDVGIFQSIIQEGKYEFQVNKTPDVIIDAGSNIGLSVIYFAEKYPSARIIAIEPEDSNYKLLKKNTEGYSNIHLIKAGVWNSVGESTILMGEGGRKDGFVVGTENDYQNIKTLKKVGNIKTVTIDKILHDFNFEKVDILKIDIEGSEKEVFENCSNWIGKINSIIIELHERTKKGCNKSFNKIANRFNNRCENGEDVYLSKDNYIKMTKRKE